MKTENRNRITDSRPTGRKALLATMVLLIMGTFAASAQMNLPTDPNIPDAPIDGFLAVGLIAGACIGLRKRIKGLKE